MRKGEPQIEVVFDIDSNGILSVSAKEKTTGKEQKIRIEASTGLSQEEIDKMKQEAEANAEADRQAREKVDKLNEADSIIYQTERQMTEYGKKLPENLKADIEKAVTELKAAHQAQDLDAINKGIEAVNNAWAAASQQMGGQPGAGGPEAGPQGPTNDGQAGGDDVTDVEFEEVDSK